MNSWFLLKNPANKATKLLVYQTKNSNWSIVKLRQVSTTQSYLFNSSQIIQQQHQQHQQQQQQQQQQPKRSKGSSTFKVFAFAITGFTLGLGYVTLNPDSRTQIESYVPQSKYLFEYIDGLLNTKPKLENKPAEQPSSYLKVAQNQSSSLPQPIVPTPQTPSPPQQTSSAAPAKPATSQKQQKSQPVSSETQKPTETTPAEQTENLDWKNTLKKFDLQQEATVDAIESKLRQLNSEVKLRVSEALNSSYVAIESLNKYRKALRQALDETKDEETKELQWRQVTNLFETQQAEVNEANLKFALARKTIEDLDSYLKEAKSNDLVVNVKNLRETQNDLIDQYRRLQAEQNKLSETVIHANVLRTYTAEQKMARNQFLKEIQSLQPEGISKSSGDQLSSEEINSLLIHAHKRVLQLQKQIEKLQSTQNQQIQAALEEQRKQNAEFLKQYETSLKSLHEKEFSVEKDKIIEVERQKANDELKKELARQAAAHNNHLAQMLRIQQNELQSIHEKQLLIESEKIRQEFYSKVASTLGRVKGIENALNARANLELQANNAKQLWLAVQTLNEILNSKASELNSNENELVNIRATIERIRQSAPDNEFIQKLINSIQTNALDQGVWSEPDLRERFHKLKRVCNQVALIDDRGGSLFKYAISYLQSFFILHAKIDRQKLDKPADQINLNELNLNTFNILDYSEFYLENGNIDSAIKLLQQLRGEPARLARDWINDAIRLSEIKQISDLLIAYISSIYIGTKFK